MLRLKQYREMRGYTQRDFADKIGVELRTYGSWEREEVSLKVEHLLACAEALDCSCDALLGRVVRQDYDDPMERELHKVWRGLDVERRERLLSDARDMAVAQALGDTPAATGSPGAISA